MTGPHSENADSSLKPSWARCWCRFTALIFFFLAFEFLDPFGISAATRQATDRLQSAITAPFHGIGVADAAEHVAVVEIDTSAQDAQAHDTGERWPIPLRAHALWLQAVLDAKPLAVFVDINFQDRGNNQLDDLAPVIEAAASAGIPVLFAAGPPGRGLPPPLDGHEAVNAWTTPDTFYPLQVPAAPNTAPHLVNSPAHERQPVAQGASQAAAPHNQGDGAAMSPTASFALYEALCGAGRLPAFCRKLDPVRFQDPLLVRWSAHPDLSQQAVNSGCGSVQGMFRPLLEAVLVAAYSVSHVTREALADRRPCRPLLALRPHELSGGLADGSDRIASLLKGRVVFYGANLEGDNDFAPTPNGPVPGVYLHAQAFENLLAYGREYFAEPPAWFAAHVGPVVIHVTAPELLLAAIWLAISVLLAFEVKILGALPARNRPAILIAMTAAVVLLAGLDLAQRAGVAVNWTGPAVLLSLGTALAAYAAAGAGRMRLGIGLGLAGFATILVYTVLLVLFGREYGRTLGFSEFVLLLFCYALLAAVTATALALGSGLLSRLLLLLVGSAWVGLLNELWLRWPGTDWIALILLYFALGHARGKHAKNFTDVISDWLETLIKHIRPAASAACYPSRNPEPPPACQRKTSS